MLALTVQCWQKAHFLKQTCQFGANDGTALADIGTVDLVMTESLSALVTQQIE